SLSQRCLNAHLLLFSECLDDRSPDLGGVKLVQVISSTAGKPAARTMSVRFRMPFTLTVIGYKSDAAGFNLQWAQALLTTLCWYGRSGAFVQPLLRSSDSFQQTLVDHRNEQSFDNFRS